MMQVQVTGPAPYDETRVRFRSADGEAVARWMTEPAPASGDYTVELDVPDAVSWEEIEIDSPEEQGLRLTNGRIALIGRIDDHDEHVVVTLSLLHIFVLFETKE